VVMLQRKNDIRPFEDAASLEFLGGKNDAPLFLFCSHNKKRPHNLVLGRLFDSHMYDMVELGVTKYTGLTEYGGSKKSVGSHPLMVFAGEAWERSASHGLLRSLLLDTFAAKEMKGVSLQGIDHIIQVTAAADDTVYFRPYGVSFLESGSKVPRVELHGMGPDLDFTIRRSHAPSADLRKAAMRVPAGLTAKKVKNVTHDEFGEKLGRVHMQRQDFTKLDLRKTKGAKSDKRRRPDGEAAAAEGGEGEDDAAPAPAAGGAGREDTGASGGGARRAPAAKRSRHADAADEE